MKYFARPTMSYAEFVALHSRRATRAWHCVCTIIGIELSAVLLGVWAILEYSPARLGYTAPSPWWHAAIWSCVYVLNSLSHPILEKNRPASTRSIRMFFRAVLFNFRMTWDTLRGAV